MAMPDHDPDVDLVRETEHVISFKRRGSVSCHEVKNK